MYLSPEQASYILSGRTNGEANEDKSLIVDGRQCQRQYDEEGKSIVPPPPFVPCRSPARCSPESLPRSSVRSSVRSSLLSRSSLSICNFFQEEKKSSDEEDEASPDGDDTSSSTGASHQGNDGPLDRASAAASDANVVGDGTCASGRIGALEGASEGALDGAGAGEESAPKAMATEDTIESVKTATKQKDTRMKRDLLRRFSNRADFRTGGKKTHDCSSAARGCSASALSLDEDVATVNQLLFDSSFYAIGCWVFLMACSYWAAPAGCIQWLTGKERNACLVELSILATALAITHGPLLWEFTLEAIPLELPSQSSSKSSSKSSFGSSLGSSLGFLRGSWPKRRDFLKHKVSGILFGGLVVQGIAIATATINIIAPVPVLIDPVLRTRVHLMRWSEWAPLAGLMTLMTECIDAPEYDGKQLTHQWERKFFYSALQSVSTLFGWLFPFCPGWKSWAVCMVLSCSAYLGIFVRYHQKHRCFQCMRRGTSVDEIELYERSRMSLALLATCCAAWSLIVIMFFVSSCGPLVLPASWAWIHDPSATMVSECFMDLVSKILYMALIIEAHYAAFDEAKRANRRLAELKNTMSIVWESSSDVIAISVRKPSGSVTSMVSPSFFRPVLNAPSRENLKGVSAVVMEVADRPPHVSTETRAEDSLPAPSFPMKVIHKTDFFGWDLQETTSSSDDFQDILVGHAHDGLRLRIFTFTDILSRAWHAAHGEMVFEHDAVVNDGPRIKFEFRVTRLEENALVIVIRDVSERYRRFEAEKRFVFETTARQKDAQANRFTRHEVKNGLLAAIEICGNLRERFSKRLSLTNSSSPGQQQSNDASMEGISELDNTLHEVLDIILAETMARDVIHEQYVPKMERVNMNYILSHTRGFKASFDQFKLIRHPSPLPTLLSDQGLLKCIYGNAITNALKYGKYGGDITTKASYDFDAQMFQMKVTNLPGPGHDQLVALGNRANELVFSHGVRLHKDSDLGKRSHSAGDGAWIIQKCASILGGTVEIYFEPTQTVFVFRAPLKVYDVPKQEAESFRLPEGVWGIAIDDSKIQRKLLARFFTHAGIPESHQIIMGKCSEEITGFVDFVINFIRDRERGRLLIIADENLEIGDDYANHETVSGSECIQTIRRRLSSNVEKNILALVRSANDSPNDLTLYQSRAHGYIPKVPMQGLSVREMVSPLWLDRFPRDKYSLSTEIDMVQEHLCRVESLENLRDMTLISSAELMQSLEQIDMLCVPNDKITDRWPVLWDKLHQLKGDMKSMNVDSNFSKTIAAIEELRGDEVPHDFMSKWMIIRSEVVLFYDSKR